MRPLTSDVDKMKYLWSDPRTLRLSDLSRRLVYFSNSSDNIVCIRSDESIEPPTPNKKLTDFLKAANARSPTFPNKLRRYKLKPGVQVSL